MAIKIALVSANRHKEPYPVYPLGLAYLKSYLQEHLKGCRVEVLDMNLLSEQQLQQALETGQFDFVGVSIRNVDGANSLDRRGFLPDYKRIIRVIKKSTSVPLILGGAGFSIFPGVFMRELGADYGIKGEGERAFCDLITALTLGNTTEGIPQLYKPEWHNPQECCYIASPQAEYDPYVVGHYWKESGMLNIQTKRGCPYHCIYCTYPQIDGCRVRTMDVEAIVETLARAKKDYGANYWFFTDSVFNICNSYNMELAEALVKSDLQISWGAYFSPSNLTDEQMGLFRASGLTHMEYGTESFCDETLEAYGKNFTFSEVLRCSELALKHHVFYAHFMILGGWGETLRQLDITIEHSKQLKYTVIFPYIGMRIYPNTKLHAYAIQKGVVHSHEELLEPAYYLTEGFDLEQTRAAALNTGKGWVFPDTPQDELVQILKLKRNKKGPLWEYLRKP